MRACSRGGVTWRDLCGDAHDGTELLGCSNCGEVVDDTRFQGINGWGWAMGVTKHSMVIRGCREED